MQRVLLLCGLCRLKSYLILCSVPAVNMFTTYYLSLDGVFACLELPRGEVILDPNRVCKKSIPGVKESLLEVQRKQLIDTCFVLLSATRCRVDRSRGSAGVAALGESLRLIAADRPQYSQTTNYIRVKATTKCCCSNFEGTGPCRRFP